MTGRIALGVIGCGFFAQNHLNSWKDLSTEGVDLVAVCDRDAAKAEAAAKNFGVAHWYTDPKAMFAGEKLGLVDIITQMDTHGELVQLALDKGVPTIVQKPFAPDLAGCEAMVAASDKAGLFLAIHENFRFQAPLRRVGDILKSGVIGKPNWARISFRTGYDIYKGQPYLAKEKRFVIIDLGVHVLDMARVYLGEVEHLSAETQRRNPNVAGEDTMTALLKHKSGAVSVVECTYESRRLPDTFPATLVEIEGEEGSIRLNADCTIETTVNGELTSEIADAPLLHWAARPWHVVQDSVLQTCRHLLRSVQADRPAETSAHDNIKTFALGEAAYESMATGRAVRPRF